MSYGILILNKHPEIANACIQSIKEQESLGVPIVVVCDNHSGEAIAHDVGKVAVYGDFCFSKSVNIGFAAMKNLDVFLMNDDVTIVEPNTISNCATLAGAHGRVGILAPMVDGGVGNPYQDWNRQKELWPDDKWHLDVPGRKSTDMPVCFVAVFLKRKLIRELGPRDENFTEYGFDDNDYCIRARRKEWKTTITRLEHVKHGVGGPEFKQGHNWNVTYMRENRQSNEDIFRNKYGLSNT